MGHTVMKFETGIKKIGGCIACKKCAKSGGRCVIKDDFESLVPLVKRAQVLVLAAPLYSYALPAQLKAAIDRFYCFGAQGGLKHIRESVLMLCGGDENEESYQGAVYSYRQYSDYQGWKDRGIILAAGISEKGAVYGNMILEKCKLLGKRI